MRSVQPASGRPADSARWRSAVSGTVIGLGVVALLNSLLNAIANAVAYSSGNDWTSGSLGRFAGVSAAGALLVAGLILGALAGVVAIVAGLAHGMSARTSLSVLSLIAILSGAADLIFSSGWNVGSGSSILGAWLGDPGGGMKAETALWTGFWSMLAGLLLAAIGSAVGERLAALERAGTHECSGGSPPRQLRRSALSA